MNSVALYSYQEALARGAETERRFFEAVHNYPMNLPAGVFKIERSTPQEDAKGVDAWMYTKYGRLPIQIKSSLCGKRKHRGAYPHLHAVVIVIRTDDTVPCIQGRTICLLKEEMAFQLRQKRRRARW